MVMVPGLPWEGTGECAEPPIDFHEMTGWVCTDEEGAQMMGGQRKVHRKMGPTRDPRWSMPMEIPRG